MGGFVVGVLMGGFGGGFGGVFYAFVWGPQGFMHFGGAPKGVPFADRFFDFLHSKPT